MPDNNMVSDHYTHGSLLDAIRQGIAELGKTESDVTLEDLGPVEEFHIGGRQASAEFLDQLELTPDADVLDVGCGLGGVARFAASRYGCSVTGIDLTDEYVRTGQVMSRWVGLQEQVSLQQGSATAMGYPDGLFDKAYVMHVGMNIADKSALLSEIFRVLKPGGGLGIFDIMSTSGEPLKFPVPWATEPSGSAVESLETYKDNLGAAGFRITAERNRHEFAVTFFDQLQARTSAAGGPPPLGLHIVMGENAPEKIANMVENIRARRIAPIEVFATKPE
jgi:ubiquinone/menaquinone biosynthesis C-methylase UbiE